ncbi:DUF2794 domain-containing protein [Limimonas halophila]|uniref:DUF2794 domain-containing protein n=1 Tax=Limimonas halophila TaxID=1082479 RepID=UPI001C40A509|nr:DUF2794 domain-containing protein [Limimonas halophila]
MTPLIAETDSPHGLASTLEAQGSVHRQNWANPGRDRPFFSRGELQQLLALYSQRVSEGVWRDYAIDQQKGAVFFCVFRHSGETPLYTVGKKADRGIYEVFDGVRRVKRTSSLDEAVHTLKRRSAVRAVT